jgi:serine/threonine protein kinase/tetratricopeptide (TPR) repeat protein
MMAYSDHEREQELFHACREMTEPEQSAYLIEACHGEPQLQARVERLLAAHRRAGNATLNPLRGIAIEEPLEQIGAYRLTRVLGEGGMGLVYEAEQTEPVRRRVALKIVKLGMDSRQVVNRFRAELQMLAALEHPHIAKLFDAGQTAAGRPYFVMELVEGTPLVDFCNEAHLPIRQRVELFILICHALQHAHQKGVIHRDLKPSNILVTGASGVATPKIIDFGIAKAVGFNAAETIPALTAGEQILGTPAYMSPEQAGRAGLDVDTRADIYSLGVILYELLAGCLPADPAGSAAVEFLARLARGELQTSRPSTRTTISGRKREIAGDLDWIVMKALETDRERRYDSAAAFARDLERYLAGEPVTARPPTMSYRMARFVRRNRIQVVAAGLVALALAIGAAAAGVGFVRARRAEAVAREEAASARQVSEFLTGLFGLPNPTAAPGSPTTVRELLDRGAARIETELKDQPRVQVNLLNTLAHVYETLGAYGPAREMAEKALAIGAKQGWEDDLQTAEALLTLGHMEQRFDRFEEARRSLERALDIRLRLLGENNLLVSIVLNGLGSLYGQMEKFDDALAAHRRALAIQQRAGGPEHIRVFNSLRGIGIVLERKGDGEGALASYRGALAVAEKNYGANHPIVADCLNNIGRMLRDTHHVDEAEVMLKRSLELRRKTLGPNHFQVSFDCAALGRLLAQKGKLAEARAMFEEAIRIRVAVVGPENIRTGELLANLGRLHMQMGQTADACRTLQRALRIYLKAYGPAHSQTMETRKDLAYAFLKARRYEEAIPNLREVLLSNAPVKAEINLADARFDPLRRMPAFRELRRSLRVPSSGEPGR